MKSFAFALILMCCTAARIAQAQCNLPACDPEGIYVCEGDSNCNGAVSSTEFDTCASIMLAQEQGRYAHGCAGCPPNQYCDPDCDGTVTRQEIAVMYDNAHRQDRCAKLHPDTRFKTPSQYCLVPSICGTPACYFEEPPQP